MGDLGTLRHGVKGEVAMAFSVAKSRPFRSLGLYRSTGKHAAPKGWVPESRPSAREGHSHRPAHAATTPRLTGPHADIKPATDTESATDTEPATDIKPASDTEQRTA
jgi:hypothetical protein